MIDRVAEDGRRTTRRMDADWWEVEGG